MSRLAALRTVVPVRALLGVVLATALGFTLTAPSASADDLNNQRQRVLAQLASSQQELGESSQQLNDAAVAVESAQDALVTAQDQLAATRERLAAARAADVAMAAKLKGARHELAVAKAAVVAGQRKLDAEQALAGTMVRDQYQQQTNLLPMAVLLSDQTTTDLQTRMQWGTTMLDTTSAQIDRLTVLQQALQVQRDRQATLEREVAKDRLTAATNLKKTSTLERRAARQTAGVAALVRQRQAVRAAAAVAVANDRQQVRSLNAERASVEHRIAVRIAQARAEAARKAAAARAAKAAAHRAAVAQRARALAAAKRAARVAAVHRARVAAQERAARSAAKHSKKQAHKKQAHKRHRTASQPAQRHSTTEHKAAKHKSTKHKAVRHKKKRSSYRSGSSRHHGFIYPVNGPITSPYGRRFHPILHVWKLHDGTDFGAGCGTPIHAAYSGRVAERYYNSAYGNRLMIDHGSVNGRYVTTGYNHAQRYKVHVGQHVRRGQVIGYVGATGYATGCHLHLMVWLNGNRVNPMSWY